MESGKMKIFTCDHRIVDIESCYHTMCRQTTDSLLWPCQLDCNRSPLAIAVCAFLCLFHAFFSSLSTDLNWFKMSITHHNLHTHIYVRTCAQTQTTYVRVFTHRTTNDISNDFNDIQYRNLNSTYEFSFDSNVHRIHKHSHAHGHTDTGSHSRMDVRTHDECIQSINPFYFGFVSN